MAQDAALAQVAEPVAAVPAAAAETAEPRDRDYELDALHILPLWTIPLQTPPLRRARLIKNVRLESMVELFASAATGSGHVHPSKLHLQFEWPERPPHPDYVGVNKLARLHSFDVYSLRLELHRLDVAVNDVAALRLSATKNQELTTYMKAFTGPLINAVYGGSGSDINDFDQLITMFSRPNKEEALRNLKQIADKLHIELGDVPRFLEDYGDIFLSLAYYREILDGIVPKSNVFLDEIRSLRSNYQVSQDRRVMEAVEYLQTAIGDVTASLTGRFESFDRHSQHFWDNMSAESFKRVKDLIVSHHTTVGGVLCGLSLKMNIWHNQFVRQRGGGPLRRAEFLLSDMRPAIDRIQKLEQSAPKNLSV